MIRRVVEERRRGFREERGTGETSVLFSKDDFVEELNAWVGWAGEFPMGDEFIKS
jgi:hypothetical protein